MIGFKVIYHADPEMPRHLGIGQGPVVHPISLESLVTNQRFQAMAGGSRINTAGDEHGASELLTALLLDTLQFCVEKATVKACVMSDQMVLRHEGCKFVHDLGDRRGSAQHLVGDAGILLNEAADFHPGVHQALKTIHDPVVLDQDGPDFNGPVTAIR